MTKQRFIKATRKRSTDEMINIAIDQQKDWLAKRRAFARKFLKTMNIFARPASTKKKSDTPRRNILAYWFPILCVVIVALIAFWAIFIHTGTPVKVIATPAEIKTTQTVNEKVIPTFDIVRIERGGKIIVAGRGTANSNISIAVNDKIIATQRTNQDGEFVYAPTHTFSPGNYTFSLKSKNGDSTEKVFVYVSAQGYENSISLLMTSDGSTLLQSPSILRDGDLRITKIDYLDTGRIVVSGDALPRLRVSLALNDKYLGFARVSDHKHFGLGADTGKLKPGERYTMTIRLHDGDGRTIAQIGHTFTMPCATGDQDTYYTVRRGDCLWVIARNFMRRGILFSIIATQNNITNPNLIFPKQLLRIPIHGTK